MKKKILAAFLSILMLAAPVSLFSGCKDGNDDNKGNNGGGQTFTATKEGLMDLEVSQYKADYQEDELYTITQSGMTFAANHALPLDCVMVYPHYSQVESTVQSYIRNYEKYGYKEVGLMVALGRDQNSYYCNGSYDGDMHWEIVQSRSSTENADGTDNYSGFAMHGTSKEVPYRGTRQDTETYYVCPTIGFCDYLVDYISKGIDAGATTVCIEEPDYWTWTGYEKSFQAEWQEYYGEEWVPLDQNDKDVRFKYAELKAYIMTRAMDHISTTLKEKYKTICPELKIILCTHSNSNYSNWSISANNYDILALPNIDGLVLQAWSDTSSEKFNLKGDVASHVYEYSYMEYIEGINYGRLFPDKRIYALNDPLADNESMRESDAASKIYMGNILAETINPVINSYECVWPDRYLWSDGWYKSIQESVYKMLNSMAKEDATLYSGTTGIASVISYSAVADGEGNQHGNSNLCIAALSCNLIASGVPVQVLTLEAINDISYLNGIHTLILSYDHIKPTYSYAGYGTSAEYRKKVIANEVIAQWVKNGGNLIYVGGENDNQDIVSWWNTNGNDYDSPEAELFERLGLDVSVSFAGNVEEAVIKNASSHAYMSDHTITDVAGVGYKYTEYNVQGAETLYKLNNKNLIVEAKAGSGSVIIAGLEPAVLLASSTSYMILEELCTRACEIQGKQFNAPLMMYCIRGDYHLIKTYNRSYTLEDGYYVDLFSTKPLDMADFPDLTVMVNPEVSENSQYILKKLDMDVDSGSLLYANGDIKEVEVLSNKTVATIKNICKNPSWQATYGISLWKTGGSRVASLVVTYEDGKEPANLEYYVDDNGILHISYQNNTTKDQSVIIEITWR